jgi:streptogramin lyase
MIVELAVAEPGAGPYGVAAGPDGALWVTLVHAGDLARVTTAVGEDGGLRHHDLPSPRLGAARRHGRSGRRPRLIDRGQPVFATTHNELRHCPRRRRSLSCCC